MRYMVIEHFKSGKAGAIYRRFADKGRMAPEGLHYIDSWVSADLGVCFQLMETVDDSLFAQWTAQWNDLVDFEIIPIISSAEARIKSLGNS
jgi:Protein of unknown function (DUF3303)